MHAGYEQEKGLKPRPVTPGSDLAPPMYAMQGVSPSGVGGGSSSEAFVTVRKLER